MHATATVDAFIKHDQAGVDNSAPGGQFGDMMKELLRSNDLVYLSFVSHLLEQAGIDFIVLDSHMSAVEGSIGALPRRIAVADDKIEEALGILGNASLTIDG